MGINVLSLFDGMSCGRLALQRAGIEVDNYYSSEIDKWAIKVADDNWPQDTMNRLGDINNWREWDIDWGSIDLVIGGSPCQGFSYAGDQLAFDDERSKLYFMFEDIVREKKPRWWFLENVRMKPEHIKTLSDRLGVQEVKINSSLVSAQNRVRYYWFNWDVENVVDENITLQDIIPEAKGVWTWPRGWNKGGCRECNKCPTLTTSSWQHNFKWFDENNNLYKFTPEECEDFQTVPVGYTKGVSDNQRYKILGNGWTVDVIAHILEGIKK